MKVKVIPTGVHGMLDYLASGVNLAFPRLLGLQDAPWAATVPRLDGLAGLGYSLITDYELGAFRALPMPTHLALDAAKGLFMASSPWLFGFAKNGTRYWLPHVLMGTADVVAVSSSPTGTTMLARFTPGLLSSALGLRRHRSKLTHARDPAFRRASAQKREDSSDTRPEQQPLNECPFSLAPSP